MSTQPLDRKVRLSGVGGAKHGNDLAAIGATKAAASQTTALLREGCTHHPTNLAKRAAGYKHPKPAICDRAKRQKRAAAAAARSGTKVKPGWIIVSFWERGREQAVTTRIAPQVTV
ncbi:hypothetical protein GCM10007973_09900 [Polymorphobacter multimanifer]|nr:hypothetical protein GCM10007973_09900 [Polymorphobacter multimanifer]